ncbi:hypothetical protein EDB81DRAFT_246667 [Dactylonectria macrodidyma]|uniref:Zn(2)-C6 fungal-type domain-containing protein n=1 Tax=Dactylonectria macrodidyma TaxID=307937 RepID=A0A9P9DBX2_9HYPO|nr:hypothetical protein EDB81DRAFT_246667 [Dactylonectria macrodidyma]
MSDNASAARGGGSRSPPAAVPMPNHFSCVNCRRRKVKCNKTNPCTNCTRAQLTCIFPPPRRGGKGDLDPDPALIAKVHHLENIIGYLQSAMAEKDAQLAQQRQLQTTPDRTDQQQEQRQEQQPQQEDQQQQDQGRQQEEEEEQDKEPEHGQEEQKEHEHEQEQLVSPTAHIASPTSPTSIDVSIAQPHTHLMPLALDSPTNSASPPWKTDWKSGIMIKDEGRNIYISGTFWAAVTAQVDDLGQLDNEDPDDGENMTSEVSTIDSPFSDFPFNASGVGKSHSHPSPENRQKLWTVFKDSIDPLVRILHMPTVEPKVSEWLSKDDVEGMPSNLNALLFAVYFSATSSMENDECREVLGSDRSAIVMKYRAAEENALTVAGLLNTDDLMVLQSFIIYLTALRHMSPRLSWTLCSLASRLLQSLGAHRDGASRSLSIFDSEMQKRLFWHLAVLECGAAEDSGCDPTIFEVSSFNASLPRNLDDKNLSVTMVTEPEEHTYWTESTLSIIWADICQLWRLVYDSRRHPEGLSKGLDAMTEAEKKEFIEKSIHRFDEKYIKICSPLIPIQWVTATLARLLILEFKLTCCKPLERHAELSEVECDDFFSDAVECLELSNKLQTDHRGVRWVWLFKTFTVWHPLAYVLTELASRPIQKEYEKAWRVVEQSMVSRWNSPYDRLGHQWRSMLNLLQIAQTARSSAMRRRREPVHSRPDSSVAPTRSVLQRQPLNRLRGAWKPSSHGLAQLSSSLEGVEPPQCNAMQFDAAADHSNFFSFNQPLGNSVEEFGDLDVGDFDFSHDCIVMEPSDAAFFQATFQVQDTFEMDLS